MRLTRKSHEAFIYYVNERYKYGKNDIENRIFSNDEGENRKRNDFISPPTQQNYIVDAKPISHGQGESQKRNVYISSPTLKNDIVGTELRDSTIPHSFIHPATPQEMCYEIGNSSIGITTCNKNDNDVSENSKTLNSCIDDIDNNISAIPIFNYQRMEGSNNMKDGMSSIER